MYHDFYQFRENPFNVTADPDFFFASKSHADAISNLVYGITLRKGILVITGEIGTGKTTVCRKLLHEFNQNTKFALILNPKFSPSHLLQMILFDLGMSVKTKNKFDLLQVLNEFLIRESHENNNIVLIIDEAQNLNANQLEQIRLLSNLETDKEKLLQILLVGQPELHERLRLPVLRQLCQRVAIYYQLKPLEQEDVEKYIVHRINKASLYPGRRKTSLFTDNALNLIYDYTKGSPRTINILCDRALTAGFVSELEYIDDQIIQNCAKEVIYFEHHI